MHELDSSMACLETEADLADLADYCLEAHTAGMHARLPKRGL